MLISNYLVFICFIYVFFVGIKIAMYSAEREVNNFNADYIKQIGNKMKLFNKTVIALTLSLLGAASSVSALAMVTDNAVREEVEIKVVESTNDNMNIFVSVDGEVTTKDVSSSVMNNPEALRELLVDVPDNIREKLIESLTSQNIHNDNYKVVIDGDGDIHQELHWLSKSDNEVDHSIEVILDNSDSKVIVMEFDENDLEGNIAQKVIKQMIHTSGKERSVQVIPQGNMSAESIMRMIKHSNFTADDLNEIQQVLDAKR
jgi:hypothetical protein